MTSWRRTLPWLLAGATLVGCTGGSPPAGAPPTPPLAPSASGQAGAPRAVTAPGALPTTTTTLAWRPADLRFSRLSPTNVGARYKLMGNPGAPAQHGDEGTTIVRIADGQPVATYQRSSPAVSLYRAFFWQDTAIIQETVHDMSGPEGGRIHLTRYDLARGTRTPLRPADGRRLGFLGAAALAGNLFAAAIEKDGQKDRCLHIFDLSTGAEHDAACVAAGPGGIFSVRGSDSGLTYLATDGATVADCRSAYWVPATAGWSGRPQRLGDTDCHAYDHARIGDWSVWSDIPADQNAVRNHGRGILQARSGTGAVTLGVVDSNSTVSCGGHVYWRAPEAADPDAARILRWKPGATSTEIVFPAGAPATGDRWTTYFPSCDQNVLTIGRRRTGPTQPPAREVHYLVDP